MIYRLPLGRSIVSPPSACPGCGHQLSWWENVPLLSYVLLRGRCRSCDIKISGRYPAVELITAGAWAAIAAKIGLAPELPAFLAFASVLMILSGIDLEHRRIPDKVLLPASLAAAVLLTIAAAASDRWTDLARAGIGAVAFGVPMLAIGLIVPRGMGMGDIKLAPYLGFHLGWISPLLVAVGAFIGFFAGALIGVLMIVAGRKTRKDALPFGPFLSLGAFIAIIWGERLVTLWLG